jgi:116 kDa U5 small nuclear ribonucleoprotein component
MWAGSAGWPQVMVQTERMLRHLITERLPLTVVITKVDRLILELKLPPADAYFKLRHTLDEINAIAAAASLGRQEWRVSPELGNVCFASGQGGWSFTLPSFAKLYADTYGQPPCRAHRLCTRAPMPTASLPPSLSLCASGCM